MKRKFAFQGTFALGLSLLLLLSGLCAAAEEQDQEPYQRFGQSVNWDTTMVDMREIQGVGEDEELDEYSVGEYAQYGFAQTNEDGVEAYGFYIFRADQLAMYGVNMAVGDQAGETGAAGLYEAYLAKLTEKYGDPTTEDKRRLTEVYAALGDGTMDEEEIRAFAGWDLGGGTELYLVNAYGQSVIYLYTYRDAILETGE